MQDNETIPLPISFFNTTLLKQLQTILTFGSQKISLINPIHQSFKLKRKNLYTIIYSSQQYAEAIVKLITPPTYNIAAEVLLRSLMEQYINARYIYSDHTHQNAFNFFIDALKEQLTFGISFKQFAAEHPAWNIPKEWDTFIAKTEKNLNTILKKKPWYSNKVLPNLYTRALEVDTYLESKGYLNEETSAIYYYRLIYHYYSQSMRTSDLQITNEDIDRVLTETYQIYYSTLLITLKEFNLYTLGDFQQFNKYFRQLHKK
jgi:hypothetical protein